MSRLIRGCGVAVVAVVAAVSCGCLESDNIGKLENTRWSSAYVPDFKGVSGRGMTMTLQFSDGGRFAMSMSVPQGLTLRCGGTWRLGPGDVVYLEDVSPAVSGHSWFRERMTVAGDTLVMEDPDGTKIVFTRLDEPTRDETPPTVTEGTARR